MRLRFLAILAGSILLSLPALADTYTYTYTGNDFTKVAAPYTTSDSITGSFTLDAPLAANLNGVGFTPDSWSFTDGVHASQTGNISDQFFMFVTDASGSIIGWNIVMEPLGTATPFQTFNGVNGGKDHSLGQNSFDPSGNVALNRDAPGTWTETINSSSPVPEPSSLMLLSTGILGLTGAARRKFSLHS